MGSKTVVVLDQPGNPYNPVTGTGGGVTVGGEDCFPGDEVTCDENEAKYLVALGRARWRDGADTPAEPTPPAAVRRSKPPGPAK